MHELSLAQAAGSYQIDCAFFVLQLQSVDRTADRIHIGLSRVGGRVREWSRPSDRPRVEILTALHTLNCAAIFNDRRPTGANSAVFASNSDAKVPEGFR